MQKGKLKIFFGYCAGVGKTYKMLKEGHKLLKEGNDVVLGYFEPHDRKDTMALTEGFETIPLKEINYKGIILKEFDVKKAIERHPEYILVDELAHTNVTNSRNRKRYLDILELLNNGINVLTTVNVQHLESLNDIIDNQTNVDVNERVPDDIFNLADEIAIVDIEPSDLINRMYEGKIYKSDKIDVALSNFFKEDNLALLRELALRKMADRIERIKNNGLNKVKFLVLISPSPSSAKNIRVASRMAEAYHAKFCALYVETNNSLNEFSASTLKEHMKLVKDLNGEVIIKYSDDVVSTIENYVKIAGVTNVVIGKTWKSIGKKESFENKIISRLPDIEVLIVPDRDNIMLRKSFKLWFQNIFLKNRREKYLMSNKTLDIIRQIEDDVKETTLDKCFTNITLTLSRAFNRCIYLRVLNEEYVCSYNNIDVSFFENEKELACINYTLNNKIESGRGTNTLRNAKSIYIPITYDNKILGVLGLSTISSKLTVTEKLILEQIKTHLNLIIYFLVKDKI